MIGADHRGFQAKHEIKLRMPEIIWIDVGCNNQERCDYPEYAYKLVCLLQKEKSLKGVLLCGSGVGMSIAANKFSGIRAALVWNEQVAYTAAAHDNVNILVFGTDFLSLEQIISCIRMWENTQFLGGRYQERLEQIEQLCCSEKQKNRY